MAPYIFKLIQFQKKLIVQNTNGIYACVPSLIELASGDGTVDAQQFSEQKPLHF